MGELRNPVLIPAGLNRGHAYRDQVRPTDLVPGLTVSRFYAARYGHSPQPVWLQRLDAGEIFLNGVRLGGDAGLQPGDRLVWHRPPWQEPAVPDLPEPLHDDGDLLVLDKPGGLPVLPGGGFLEHTVLHLLERRLARGCLDGGAGLPRPVHRLGRGTSGLLVCARRAATRAWLSALLRDSTAREASTPGCHKLYRALLSPAPAGCLAVLPVGERLPITTPIGRRPHPRLGEIWAAGGRRPLSACSTLTLLERREDGWLVAVAIASGRPHQIRIHTAAIGAPLLGDPLYRPGGSADPDALPGQGGYHLHAHRLRLTLPTGGTVDLEAPLPPALRSRGDGLGMAP